MYEHLEKIKKLLPIRPKNSHKGMFGRVLNIAGSANYRGAAYFSSVAPLKVGCGLVTLASVEEVINSVSTMSPDVILLNLPKTKNGTISAKSIKVLEKNIERFNAISIGCGISKEKDTVKFFNSFINIVAELTTPVVVDADGLNILAKQKYKKLPKNLILTPHPKEMASLMGVGVENILSQPEFWVRKCCDKYNCTTVLKLHKTIVADNMGMFYENCTGNSALSHGGSGDILCGMISGFLASGSRGEPELACGKQAKQGELNDGDVRVCSHKLHRSKQGLSYFEASCLAVYLHGIAGELASDELSEHGAIASDIVKYLPLAIKSIL